MSEEDWTTDKLTKAHIVRLQRAWQDANASIETERRTVASLKTDTMQLKSELSSLQREDRTKDLELFICESFSMSPENPFALIKACRSILPDLPYHGEWIFAATIRTGDHWVAITTETNKMEEMAFQCKTFDNYLKFKQHVKKEDQSSEQLESLQEILPAEVVNYIITGLLPGLHAEGMVYGDEVPELDRRRFQFRNFAKAFVLPDLLEGRCILFCLSKSDISHSERYALNDGEFERGSKFTSLKEFAASVSLHNNTADVDWKAIFLLFAQLFVSSLIKCKEHRTMDRIRLTSSLSSALHQLSSDTQVKSNAAILYFEELLLSVRLVIEGVLANQAGQQNSVVSLPMQVSCDMLITSKSVMNATDIPVITSARKLNWIRAASVNEIIFDTIDAAQHAAFRSAMITEQPAVRMFSKLTQKLQKQSPRALGIYNAESAFASLYFENHMFLAIPLTDVAEEGIFGCLIVQFSLEQIVDRSIQDQLANVSSTFPQSYSSLGLTLALSQHILQCITASLQDAHLKDVISQGVIKSKFSAMNIFSDTASNESDESQSDFDQAEIPAEIWRYLSFKPIEDPRQDDSFASRMIQRFHRLLSADFAIALSVGGKVPLITTNRGSTTLLKWTHTATWLKDTINSLQGAVEEEQVGGKIQSRVVIKQTPNTKQSFYTLQLQVPGDLSLLSLLEAEQDLHADLQALFANDERVASKVMTLHAVMLPVLDDSVDASQLVLVYGRFLRKASIWEDQAHASLSTLIESLVQHQIKAKQQAHTDSLTSTLSNKNAQTDCIHSFNASLLALQDTLGDSQSETPIGRLRGSLVSAVNQFINDDFRIFAALAGITVTENVSWLLVARSSLAETARFAALNHKGEWIARSDIFLTKDCITLFDEPKQSSVSFSIYLVPDGSWMKRVEAAQSWWNVFSQRMDWRTALTATLVLFSHAFFAKVDTKLINMDTKVHHQVLQHRVQVLYADNLGSANTMDTTKQHSKEVLHSYVPKVFASTQHKYSYPLQSVGALPFKEIYAMLPSSAVSEIEEDDTERRQYQLAIDATQFSNVPRSYASSLLLPQRLSSILQRILRQDETQTTSLVPAAEEVIASSNNGKLTMLPQGGKMISAYIRKLYHKLGEEFIDAWLGHHGAELMARASEVTDDTAESKRSIADDSESKSYPLVLLYEPLYPNSFTGDESWKTYHLIVIDQDQMLGSSFLQLLLEFLNDAYIPSQIAFSMQPWFECIHGIEKLLLTSAFPSVDSDDLGDNAVADSLADQMQNVMDKAATVLFSSVGNRVLSASGYVVDAKDFQGNDAELVQMMRVGRDTSHNMEGFAPSWIATPPDFEQLESLPEISNKSIRRLLPTVSNHFFFGAKQGFHQSDDDNEEVIASNPYSVCYLEMSASEMNHYLASGRASFSRNWRTEEEEEYSITNQSLIPGEQMMRRDIHAMQILIGRKHLDSYDSSLSGQLVGSIIVFYRVFEEEIANLEKEKHATSAPLKRYGSRAASKEFKSVIIRPIFEQLIGEGIFKGIVKVIDMAASLMQNMAERYVQEVTKTNRNILARQQVVEEAAIVQHNIVALSTCLQDNTANTEGLQFTISGKTPNKAYEEQVLALQQLAKMVDSAVRKRSKLENDLQVLDNNHNDLSRRHFQTTDSRDQLFTFLRKLSSTVGSLAGLDMSDIDTSSGFAEFFSSISNRVSLIAGKVSLLKNIMPQAALNGSLNEVTQSIINLAYMLRSNSSKQSRLLDGVVDLDYQLKISSITDQFNFSGIESYDAINDVEYNLFWYTKDSFTNDVDTFAYHPASKALMGRCLEEAIQTGEVVTIDEVELSRYDGSHSAYLAGLHEKGLLVSKVLLVPIASSSLLALSAVIEVVQLKSRLSSEVHFRTGSSPDLLNDTSFVFLRNSIQTIIEQHSLQSSSTKVVSSIATEQLMWQNLARLLPFDNASNGSAPSTRRSGDAASRAAAYEKSAEQSLAFTEQFCFQLSQVASIAFRGVGSFFVASEVSDVADIVTGVVSFAAKTGQSLQGLDLNARSISRLRQVMKEAMEGSGLNEHCSFINPFSIFTAVGEQDQSPHSMMVSIFKAEGARVDSLQVINSGQRGSSNSKVAKLCILVVEVNRSLTIADGNAMSFLAQLIRNYVFARNQTWTLNQKEIDLRSLAGTLAESSKTVLMQQERSAIFVQIWNLLGTIDPPMYSKHFDGDVEDITSVTFVVDRFTKTISTLKQYFNDAKELSVAMQVNFKADLLYVSQRSRDIMNNALKNIGASTMESSAWYEKRYSDSRGTDTFFLPVAQASSFMGSKFLGEDFDQSDGISSLLGALALQTYHLIIDDMTRGTGRYRVLLPILREEDVTVYTPKDSILIKYLNDYLPDMDINSISSSNWVLEIVFESEDLRNTFLREILASGMARSYSEDSNDPLKRSSTRALADFDIASRHLVSNILLSLREFIQWNRNTIMQMLRKFELAVKNEVDGALQAAFSSVQAVEGFLSRVEENNFTSVIGTERLSAMLSQELNTGVADSSSSAVDISRLSLLWRSVDDLSIANATMIIGDWRATKVPRARVTATGETRVSAADDRRLSFLQSSAWEVIASTLTVDDIARSFGSTNKQYVRHYSDEGLQQVLLVIDTALGPCILELNLEYKNLQSTCLPWRLFSRAFTDSFLQTHQSVLTAIVQSVQCSASSQQRMMTQIQSRSFLQRQVTTLEQRQRLLAECLQLLTQEGNSALTVLQRFQLLVLQLLPGVTSCHLTCRDSSEENKVLYEETLHGSVTEAPSMMDPGSLGRSPSMMMRSPSLAMSLGGTPRSPSFRMQRKGVSDSAPNTPMMNGGGSGGGGEASGPFRVENAFDCHEISGQFIVRFAYALTEVGDLQLNDIAPFSMPMTPMMSPEQRGQSSTGRASKVRFRQNTMTAFPDDDNSNNGGISDGNRQLQGSEMLLETLTRTLARRIFELHRGAKNKRLMAQRHQELHERNQLLVQTVETVEQMEVTHSMTRQELEAAMAESNRLRQIMAAEQTQLKESLSQKKEMNAHLRQSLQELRKESDRKEVALQKQVKELREKVALLETEREREKKEMTKTSQKEFASSLAKQELQKQLHDALKAQQDAENSVRTLKAEVTILAQREQSAVEGGDARLKGFLQRIRSLEEEVATARGTNAFLKKQVEAGNQSLRAAQKEHANQMSALQASMSGSVVLSPSSAMAKALRRTATVGVMSPPKSPTNMKRTSSTRSVTAVTAAVKRTSSSKTLTKKSSQSKLTTSKAVQELLDEERDGDDDSYGEAVEVVNEEKDLMGQLQEEQQRAVDLRQRYASEAAEQRRGFMDT